MGRPKGVNPATLESSRSWFAVFNNPEEHGYTGTPEEICHRLRDEWCVTETRKGAWLYCISAEGLHHVHMVLEDCKMMRFSAIKKAYCQGMHFEATKGNKAQVEAYINKTGKFEEKGEKIVYSVSVGELSGNEGKRSELVSISELIQQGLTPRDVLAVNPNYYKYTQYIKQMYFDKRDSETPFVRDVRVFWHMGESGSGKSYSRSKLVEQVGEDNIYYLTAFGNGAFDAYNGQPYLWIEDFKGEMMFGELLRILDVYKAEIHCRYSNVKALWKEIHITSIYHPKACYRFMVDQYVESTDKVEQLLRRIDRHGCIIYHYKTKDGQYKECQFPTSTLVNEMMEAAKRGEEWRIIENDAEFEETNSGHAGNG